MNHISCTGLDVWPGNATLHGKCVWRGVTGRDVSSEPDATVFHVFRTLSPSLPGQVGHLLSMVDYGYRI